MGSYNSHHLYGKVQTPLLTPNSFRLLYYSALYAKARHEMSRPAKRVEPDCSEKPRKKVYKLQSTDGALEARAAALNRSQRAAREEAGHGASERPRRVGNKGRSTRQVIGSRELCSGRVGSPGRRASSWLAGGSPASHFGQTHGLLSSGNFFSRFFWLT